MQVEIHSNTTEAFTNEASDIVIQRIAPYCDAPQTTTSGESVVQHFDKSSAETIVEAFKANAKTLLQKVGIGSPTVPVYNGHPDHGSAGSEYLDTEVYARVKKLEARDDGLWATIKKSPLLAVLKEKLGRLEISPRWNCVLENDGKFHPVQLLSLGLVAKGNLPQACVINSKQSDMTDEQINQIAEALGVEPTFDAIISHINASKEEKQAEAPEAEATKQKEETNADEHSDVGDSAPEADATGTTPDEKDARIAELEGQLAEATANARIAEAAEIVKQALANGKVVPAQQASLEALLMADFVNAKAFIESLPVASTFSNGDAVLAQAEAAVASEPAEQEDEKTRASREFNRLVRDVMQNQRQRDGSTNIEHAFKIVASTKEGAKLWEKMKG